jgi:RES domain-containing protein
MELFRLSTKKWSETLTGKGAAIKGGRWNSPGTEIVYCAASRSLAMAEVAVHFTLSTLPDDYMMVTIYAPDSTSVKMIQERDLPNDWNAYPHIAGTKAFGDDFISENKYCLLKVPSAVTKGDYNMLINPFHPEFQNITIIHSEPFPFDHRLFR